MGLRLKWAKSDRMGVEAQCGGYTLHVCENPSVDDLMAGEVIRFEWRVFRHAWSVPVGARDPKEPRKTLPTLEGAQEAAEAEVARLLAEDAGVLALLDVRWIPVSERLPDGDSAVVEVRMDAIWGKHAGRFLTSEDDGTIHDDVTHWRPLPPGPEVQP